MNTQLFSVLFSVLLASTFIHEIRAKGQPHPLLAPRRVKRNASYPTDCTQCSDDVKPYLVANSQSNCLGYVRKDAEAICMIDQQAGLIAVASGRDGMICTNIDSGKGGWVISKDSWRIDDVEQMFYSMSGGLSKLMQDMGATRYEDVPPHQVDDVTNPLLQYIFNPQIINEPISTDKEAGQLMLRTCGSQIISTGVLPQLINVIGTTRVTIEVDIAQFGLGINGLGLIVNVAPGALVNLGVNVFFNDKPAPPALVNICGSMKDITNLKNTFNTPGSFLELLANLDGPYSIYKVVYILIAFLENKASLEDLVTVIIQFYVNNKPNSPNTTCDMKKNINDIKILLSTGRNRQDFAPCLSFIEGIIRGSFIFAGVDIIVIANILNSQDSFVDIMIKIGLNLRAVVPLEVFLPTLITLLLVLLKTELAGPIADKCSVKKVSGIRSLVGLVGNLVGRVEGLLNLIERVEIYRILISLPVIGPLLENLQQRLLHGFNLRINLKVLLESDHWRPMCLAYICQHNNCGRQKSHVNQDNYKKIQIVANRCSQLNWVTRLRTPPPCHICLQQ